MCSGEDGARVCVPCRGCASNRGEVKVLVGRRLNVGRNKRGGFIWKREIERGARPGIEARH